MSNPKRHHYLSQFYLKGFADSVTSGEGEKHYLNVIDLKAARKYQSNIEDVAVKTHFNTLTINGEHIYELEKSLSRAEGEISGSFYEIRDSKILTKENLYLAISLMSLFACRTPAMRGRLQSFKEDIEESLFQTLATQSELKEEIEPIFSNKESLIQDELKMVQHLVPLLLKRKWTLLDSADIGENFIISDRAFALFHKDKRKETAGGFWGIGFGMADTVVHFPISNQLTLYGVLEDDAKLNVDIDLVTSFNGHVIGFSDRFIYFNNDGFLASDHTGKKHDEISVLEHHKTV